MVRYGGGGYGRAAGRASRTCAYVYGEDVEVEVVAPCLRMGRDGMGKGLGGMRGLGAGACVGGRGRG